MAFVVKDRVQETSTTTGTGTFTLNGAVIGFKSFSVVGNGNTTYYAITTSGSEFEVGIGTYTSSGTTLSRDTVLSSSNSNNLVNFSAGSKNVFVTYPAERSIYLDSAASSAVIGQSNTDTSITTSGTADITISTNSGTNSGTVKIFDGVNGNIEITPNGSGVVKLDGLSYPTADGSANQILKTDGSGVLSFATPSAGFSGATTTSSAVDITLTSASTQTQFVIMTAANKGVILPDATTLTTKGSPIFQIVNNGTFPFFIKNNAGFNLTQVQPGGSATLTLVDNSTSNGIFSISSIPTSNNASTYPITSLVNLAYSTPQLVKSGTSGTSTNLGTTTPWNWGVSASKLSSTSAIIFYVAGTSNRDVYGVVVSYSGTTITVNSETLLYNGSSSAALSFAGVALDASTGLIVVTRAANKICVPFTISGTTISVGTSSSTFGTSTTSRGVMSEIVAASSTLACFLDQSTADSLDYKLRTIQHNGASAPTISSQSSGTITVFDATPSINAISATQVFIAYTGGAAEYTIARIGTLSGTSTPVLETANTTSTTLTNGLSYVPFIKQISSTEFITVGILGSDKYTVSGTTVTYVSSALYKSRNMQTVEYYNMNMVFLGDFAATTIYTVNYLQTLKRDSNAYHVIGIVDFPKFISNVNSGISSYSVALDSTTALVVTNNANVTNAYSPVSAYLLKYIGS